MSQLQAMLFDLDGTLCYTAGDLLQSVNHTFSAFGLPTITAERMMVGINDAGSDFVRKCLPPELQKDDELLARVYEGYCAYYDEHLCDVTSPFPGIHELLDELKRRGIRTAVYTNKPHAQACRIISTLFAPDTFDIVLGFGRFPAKPDPSGTRYLMECLHSTPETTGYVGDSNTDMLTSVNAGTVTIGVDWGYRSEEVLLAAGARYLARGSGMAILRIVDEIAKT